MALPPNFLDELRARTPIAAYISRTVKLARSGREQKGCCPFHGEKTPSFYVYDDHFHCFGCGEHGDVITFAMKTSNAPFMEVVEALANEAGLEVPKASPQAAEQEAKRAGIAEVLEAAAKLYHKFLYEPEGAAALNYLKGRGLTDATIKKFQLGWSGEGRGSLAAALRGQNIKPDQLVEAGLMKQGDRGPVDMFFSRVMFPIRDRRGGAISFGGRIMGDGQPKYVNGPETAVFSKRRSLYGLNFAREAVRKGAALIVVEGYMDVIALHQAGFNGAVAPLGTALTEEHLDDIWRLSPEPVICFDADAAGRRAALKTVDLALSALAPDRSLKFLRLPEKEDPDSIIKKEGPRAFEQRIKAAETLSNALFSMLADGVVRNTPEKRASFRNRLIEVASRIPDKSLQAEYRSMLLDRFFEDRKAPRTKLMTSSRTLPRVTGQVDPVVADIWRMRLMTTGILMNPGLLSEVEEMYLSLPLPSECQILVSALISFPETSNALDSESMFTHLSGLGLDSHARLLAAVTAQVYRPEVDETLAQAATAWRRWFKLMSTYIDKLRADRQRAYELCVRHDKASDDVYSAATKLLMEATRILNEALEGHSEGTDLWTT